MGKRDGRLVVRASALTSAGTVMEFPKGILLTSPPAATCDEFQPELNKLG